MLSKQIEVAQTNFPAGIVSVNSLGSEMGSSSRALPDLSDISAFHLP